MKKDFGFVRPVISEEHYVLGGFGSLPKVVLQPDGQWDSFLPQYEPQFNAFYDTFGCSVFGTLNAVETYIKRIAGREVNYSERFIYILAGVRPPGSDPHKIAETIRAKGLIDDAELPMTTDFIGFIQPDPMSDKYLYLGKDWLSVTEFSHEWVYSKEPKKADKIALIKEALRYSPVAVSVTAWWKQGEVYVDRGQPNSHWTVCYGWDDEKQAWKIFDSYDQSTKLYSYDSSIEFAKRYYLSIKNRVEQTSLIQKILDLSKTLLAYLFVHPNAQPMDEVTNDATPVIPEPVSAPKIDLLNAFCLAIRDYEGSPGDLNYRNNNPGNCRFSSKGYLPIYGKVGRDANNFAIFKDYQTGWLYLNNLVKSKIASHPHRTIREFFYDYAPTSDGNSPELYAIFVAKRLGVGADFITKNLIT